MQNFIQNMNSMYKFTLKEEPNVKMKKILRTKS